MAEGFHAALGILYHTFNADKGSGTNTLLSEACRGCWDQCASIELVSSPTMSCSTGSAIRDSRTAKVNSST